MTRACAKIVKDAIWIKGIISGRLNIFDARYAESKKVANVNVVPKVSSNITADFKMFFIFSVFFSSLYWAMNFIVAWSIPRSLISCIRFGAVKAIANKPYSFSDSIFATISTPIEVIIDEPATPQNRLNPPFAEVLPNSSILLNGLFKPL